MNQIYTNMQSEANKIIDFFFLSNSEMSREEYEKMILPILKEISNKAKEQGYNKCLVDVSKLKY